MISQQPPRKQGLYDPQQEHDACGVGFVVDLKGRKSREIVDKAIQVLLNLQHRGATGAEVNTGDGAGILMQIPHEFFAKECERLRFRLPQPGRYGIGMLFLPCDRQAREACERLVEFAIRDEGQTVLGWRSVPTDNRLLGPTALAGEPCIRQVFIGRSAVIDDDAAFERKLYVVRRRIEALVKGSEIFGRELFYVPSLSARTIVYKGMLNCDQLPAYYPDLHDRTIRSALAMVHSRFSTNTFPSWSRAHPNRMMAHNGEINTLRGNINWMRARESMFASGLFGDDLKKVLPVIDQNASDSGMFDNALELLTLAGRELPHAMMMMIPEPWSNHESMSPEKKAFYEFHSCLQEPWDGPASVAFTDGVRIGAVLDRNGLRPSRYYVTSDDMVVMASEVGVLEQIPPERVIAKGRLQPGRMFLIDTSQGRIIGDDELKQRMATAQPYRRWLADNLVPIDELPPPPALLVPDDATLAQHQEIFGYTNEDLKIVLTPMAGDGAEPIGSMGTDTPLAVLSDRPQLLYNYFKQLFAQVTNPPVDAIREELIMAVDTAIGPEGNLLEPTPEAAHQIALRSPVLRNEELARLRRLDGGAASRGFRSITLPMLFTMSDGAPGMERALEELATRAAEAVVAGNHIIILSDRGVDAAMAPIPALLAVSAVNHRLLREGTRTRVGLVVESGEPREVHHFCLLLGYGASAINPYLTFQTVAHMAREGSLTHGDPELAEKKFIKAVNKGVVKVISKMGISTIQSYHGAQVFEAIGLNEDFVGKYFTWTPSRVDGIGVEIVTEEVRRRHERAFPTRRQSTDVLGAGGQYKYRREGEYHLFNPETIHKLQVSCRNGDYEMYRQYADIVNDQAKHLATLRGLMRFRKTRTPVPLDEVEAVDAIVKRFKTGAMSYGSISQEAHESLAIAMNRVGGKSNTGEGGEDPGRYVQEPNGDSKNSAIKQVASGRFGVTSEYLINARELQIKMAQGAKPGEGGQLPGAKVYPWIAKVRHSTAGVGLISPPPHHDIYSIEDLAQLIFDLKNANEKARISVKLVAEVGVGTVAAGVAKAHADVVLVSGYDGGTGASPLSSIKHAGIPWELGLAETNQVLLLNNLRSRIVVETDGQMKTGRDVAVAALLGAEEFGFATAPLVVLGCVMMRACHLNTCPVGIATQDPELRKNFRGDPAHVVNYMRFVAQELRELMADLGFRTVDEMVGHSECLEMTEAIGHWKAKGLDFSKILYQPSVGPEVGRHAQIPQDHGIERTYDRRELVDKCRPALEERKPVRLTLPIRNVQRTVGTILGSEVTRRWGAHGLPEDTIRLHFQGSAGQSFGAFIPHGVTLELEGDANDYIGKGLSGGRIIVYPPRDSSFAAEENIIIGNVALYGGTSGDAFVRGVAGERFCVRNSGVQAVVEGVGDHGCEYMTGGRVVVLGRTGRNFAAGMSGGVAYVLDPERRFAPSCNQEMVGLYALEEAEEIDAVRTLLARHVELTDSRVGRRLLDDWARSVPLFVKVLPHDYRRVIEAQKLMRAKGLSPEDAEMAAFEMNTRSHSVAPAGGK